MDVIILISIFAIVGIAVSIIVNHFFPAISLPLIQIIIGALIGLTPIGQHIELEPEIIMILIIAPLLYNEAQITHITGFVKHLKSILFYAFPLVIITVVILGFLFSYNLPMIPIAACFALGAALSPTDLVTVASLSKRMDFSEEDKTILEGEGLINDASGITAFQIAVLALTSGSFSLLQGASSLLIISIGGVIVGLILEFIKRLVIYVLKSSGIEDLNLYIILEFIFLFVAFVIAEHFHFSGVLAVVTLGLFKAMSYVRNNLFEARLYNLSSSTWKTLTTILNGVVFLYLGDQLPSILFESHIIEENLLLSYIFLVVVATLLLFLIRFMVIFIFKGFANKFKNFIDIREFLVMTFSGVKGAITLATITTLPFFLNDGTRFEDRNLLIFIASGVIVLSIIMAVVILPLLLKSKEVESSLETEIYIAEETISMLEQDIAYNKEDEKKIRKVINVYKDRIKRLKLQDSSLSLSQELRLEKLILQRSKEIEVKQLNNLKANKLIDDQAFADYSAIIKAFSNRHKRLPSLTLLFNNIRFKKKDIQSRIDSLKENSDEYEVLKDIFIQNHTLIIEMLESLRDEENSQFIDAKIIDEKRAINYLKFNRYPVIQDFKYVNEFNSIMELAFHYERRIIRELYEKRQIDHATSMKLKQNVILMENYCISNHSDSIIDYFVNKISEGKTTE